MQIAIVVVEEKRPVAGGCFLLQPAKQDLVTVIDLLVAASIRFQPEVVEVGDVGQEENVRRPVADLTQSLGQGRHRRIHAAPPDVDAVRRCV